MTALKTKDEFGKYSIRLGIEDAQTLLGMVEEMDLHPMSIKEVMAFSVLWAQLEMVVDAEKDLRAHELNQ